MNILRPLDGDVDEFLGHDDDFDDLATAQVLGNFFVGLGKPADFVFRHIPPLGSGWHFQVRQ